jgi:hypothetical protein
MIGGVEQPPEPPGSQRRDLEDRIARLEQRLPPSDAAPARKPSWDGYAAVIASFIGMLALAVSGYTAYLQRQQLRAQMWPRLQVVFSTVNLWYRITNEGTGPARVTATRITIDGVAVHNWGGVARAVGYPADDHIVSSSIKGAVLPPGKELTIAQPADNDASRARFHDLLLHGHEVAILVCYCSVLDECWVTDADDAPAACPIADADRFNG